MKDVNLETTLEITKDLASELGISNPKIIKRKDSLLLILQSSTKGKYDTMESWQKKVDESEYGSAGLMVKEMEPHSWSLNDTGLVVEIPFFFNM